MSDINSKIFSAGVLLRQSFHGKPEFQGEVIGATRGANSGANPPSADNQWPERCPASNF
jgi:hypothetical protein